jgi:hypothetical protein
MSDGKVWVVEYRHRHGVDFSAFASPQDAYRAGAQIAFDWAGREAPDVRNEVKQLYDEGDYEACISTYTAASSESVEVHELNVHFARWNGMTVHEVDCEVVHVSAVLPSQGSPGTTRCRRNFFWQGSEVTFPVNTQNFFAWTPKEKTAATCLACLVVGDS